MAAGMVAMGMALASEITYGEVPPLKAGDRAVTTGKTPVQADKGTVATLDPGTELTVVGAKENWVGIAAEQNGKKIVGWVKPNLLAPSKPSAASEAFQRGYAHHLKGELDQALDQYSEAIRLDPQYARAYNNRGLAYQARRDMRQAITDFSEAIRLSPTLVAAYLNRGVAHMTKLDYKKALADYDEAVRIDPENCQAYKCRAAVYQAMGQQEKMIADLAKAAKYYKPKYNTIAHKAMALELPLKGKDYVPNYELLESIIDAAKANIKIKKSYSDENVIAIFQIIDSILTAKKIVVSEQGLMCDALVPHLITKDIFKSLNPKGFRFRPQVGDTIYLAQPLSICLIYAAIGEALGLPIRVAMSPLHPYVRWNVNDSSHINWETSIGAVKTDEEYISRTRISNNLIQNNVYLTPLSQDETLAYEYSNLARVWIGEWAGLENELSDQARKDTKSDKGGKDKKAGVSEQDAKKTANETRANTLARHTKAMEALVKAIQLNPRAYEILLQCGTYWNMVGDFAKTIDASTLAIQLDPNQPEPYISRGVAALSRSDRQRAMDDFNKVIQINPELPIGYYFRGITYGENRDFNKAVEDLSKAIRMEPKFAKAYEIRAKVYEQLGEKDKMNEDLNTLKSLQQKK
jgi:tetratricopeptide (TPR) repeat protein